MVMTTHNTVLVLALGVAAAVAVKPDVVVRDGLQILRSSKEGSSGPRKTAKSGRRSHAGSLHRMKDVPWDIT